ncbi:MAG: hypothetical protein CME65_11985 [Halobacteriovoraceae bacterium]|nr:hypothetical protein [Halobacteriovoraceae bacterium]|tara:strand:+ start:4539 stop:4730 length:192 start_codon:yes stop_codon:yes gene_type:complete
MKSQKHNQGETAELKVQIEKNLIEDLQTMSKNSDIPIEDIVAIAIKRFKSSHADYMGIKLDYP